MTSPKHNITIIEGDGIGQEVVDATLKILAVASPSLSWTKCLAGEQVFKQGVSTGVPQQTLDSIKETKVVLKGPLTTPVGYGERSANVYLRKYFSLFANIRPVRQYPNIPSIFKDIPIDLVVVRENIEDLYAGIEYYHQPGIAQSIKLISEYGCNNINTFAFEYAKLSNRRSLHCATKANILKTTEGMMKRSFETISKNYPDINPSHMIIDNCAHQLVVNPSQFDMIVTTNMNGDIISDLTSGLVGGLGIAPSANIGYDCAMFEAVHGAAPDIAGSSKANPTAMILSAIMMCRYLGLSKEADTIEHALAITFEQGMFTIDLNKDTPLSTDEFATKIINNLGKTCNGFTPSVFNKINIVKQPPMQVVDSNCKGIDIVIITSMSYSEIQNKLNQMNESGFKCIRITNRGKVIQSNQDGQLIPQWACRFEASNNEYESSDISKLIFEVSKQFHWVLAEKLFEFE